MVVVSGIRVKNVAAYPTPAISSMVTSNDTARMTAKAVLICRPNSHPFQDRTVLLDQPAKVGRSVARAKATATNAIFDCKVLSRHHALLWYENGKFYLQDTNSSNGTFVNNNRLVAESERHEVSSGDIVQFGVDVIENNRKVTHGCIIATLKLYLPDGKEAKASPSIVENVVPLDELYKLHQILVEAIQREQCLETKLSTLQSAVDKAQKSAGESWQAFVGEERLLSRISALETQLQQAGKNWGEDKFREEIVKLQEENAAYQIAAKETMEKLHAERLQALAVATEQERCRISAEQESLLVKEQLTQTQHELEELAVKLSEEQKKAGKLEQQQWELQTKLDAETEKLAQLQSKSKENLSLCSLYWDEYFNKNEKTKEEMLAENEADLNKMNGGEIEPQNNHINLTVAPVEKKDCEKKSDLESDSENENSCSTLETIEETKEPEKHVTFNDVPEEVKLSNGPESPEENEKDDFDSDNNVDSKTLKYKYQSAQNELKKRIEILESILESNKSKMIELEKALSDEKETNSVKSHENEAMKEELVLLQQKWKESCNESQQLKDRVACLVKELEEKSKKDQNVNTTISNYEQLVNLEEELVLLKERYVEINDEKLKLQNELKQLKEQYNKMCNSSYDKMYFYIAPLILMILYLVISAMIS